MPPSINILAASGLISAGLFILGFVVSPVFAFIASLCIAPIVATTLRFGFKPSIWQFAFALVAIAFVTIANPTQLLIFFALYIFALAAPCLQLCRLFLLYRPAIYEGKPGNTEWYPAGRLVIWSAALATMVVFSGLFVATLFGYAPIESLSQTFKAALNDERFMQMMVQLSPDQAALIEGQDLDALASDMAHFFPAIFAVWCMMTSLMNFFLGGWIAHRRGWLQRSWVELSDIGLPLASLAALVISFVLSGLLSGMMSSVFLAFGYCLILAWFIQGLAVIHALVPKGPFRFSFLIAVYLLLLFPPMLLLLLVLALLDPFLKIREQAKLKSQS